MSNYYEKRDAKVRIAEELMNLGWKVYGYKEDESDSMTDYYSPANWDGIATKNGYVLVVDNKYSNMSGKEITKYNPNYISMSNADHNKIESLKNMTSENGASIGEVENAQKLISKIQAKYENQTTSRYEVIGHYPTYMNTTKGSIWHLEKDGAMADKGNKLTIFDDMPESYEFDINTMEFTDRYKEVWTGEYKDGSRVKEARQLTERERKAVNEFKSFILRLERIVNFGNSCGDGTKETEEAFQQQNENEKMVKKTFTKTKIVTKLEEVKRENSLQVGDVVRCSSGLCMITEVRENLYWSVKLGSASRGYQESKKVTWTLSRKSFDNGLLKGTLKVYNKIEVEEIETVEKWVKATTKTTAKKETVKTESAPETKEEVKEQNINSVEFTVSEDTHTKTGEKIFVAKLVNRVEKDQFMTILSKIKKLGGYYYKYKGGFIFNEDPTELLKNNFSNSTDQQKEKNISNDEIEINIENTEYKNVACNVGFEESETITINVEEEFNFDSIFDNIEIENNTRLSQDDFNEMEKLQEQYNKILSYVTDEEQRINDMEELSYFSSEGDFTKKGLLSTLYTKLCNSGNNFITDIIYHFQTKYNITLKNNFEKDQRDRKISTYQIEKNMYKDIVDFYKETNYNIILDDIFNQLGGFTFTEKEDQEIKESVKGLLKNYSKERITVKVIGNKIKDTSFFRTEEKWGFHIDYRYTDDFKKLFRGLQHFDSSKIKDQCEIITGLVSGNNIKCIDIHELNGDKVKSIKLFKNGSIEIGFKDGLTAIEFSKQYCTM